MYSIMLVEDDYIQRDTLKKIILSINSSLIIYEAESEIEALEIIKNKYIDMFFIDIELKDSSGLELALNIRKIFKYKFNLIVFVTTYIEYITQAFKLTHCYDYILKPYNKSSIVSILQTMDLYEKKDSNRNKTLEETNKKIVLKLKNNILVEIAVNDIIYIEVVGRHCQINTIHGVYTTHNISLKKIIQMIDDENIVQSHRAFLVNLKYIKKIERIDIKLSTIYFENCDKNALLGYKFKNSFLNKFKSNKIVLS